MDPNNTSTISGPSSGRQQNAIQMAFRWRADDGPTSNAGLVFQGILINTTKKPYVFVFFQGRGVPDPLPPSESAHAIVECTCIVSCGDGSVKFFFSSAIVILLYRASLSRLSSFLIVIYKK